MTQSALHTEFGGIAALRDALARRQVSAVELAQSGLDAAQAASGLNAFLHIDPDLTLAQARAADAALPWDTQAVPGGSSGGSAAAVAARLVAA
ncbi:amidase family protein, partial [Bordetella pertussis]|uniref:amidase family protein n=1 Tax=Bordetella pertussis TaxID=520 RepID=UPI000ADB8391